MSWNTIGSAGGSTEAHDPRPKRRLITVEREQLEKHIETKEMLLAEVRLSKWCCLLAVLACLGCMLETLLR